MYEPREDSYLLEKWLKRLAKGVVLDMGAGSGILAKAAVEKGCKVVALDKDDEVVGYHKANNKNSNIQFFQTDLFEIFESSKKERNDLKEYTGPRKFDTIVFNPPYLPLDRRYPDTALDGGEKGYEVLETFLNNVSGYLSTNGNILIVFSSLSKKDKIDEVIKNNLLESELLEEKKLAFETLYCYEIKKTALLKDLEKQGINKIYFLAKGHRSTVYSGVLKGKKIAIKVSKEDKRIANRMLIEGGFLKKLNKTNIGAKLVSFSKRYIILGFIEGIRLPLFLESSSKKDMKIILSLILDQLYILDKLNIEKEEMHRPIKHVIVVRNKRPILIDFERCHYTEHPKNITQFCQFLISKNITELFRSKEIFIKKQELLKATKRYKKSRTEKDFGIIKNMILKS